MRPAHAGPRPRRWSTPSSDWQDVFLAALGRRLVFAADEYYLLAGRPFPAGRRLRGLPDARGRHRHGPHVRARVPRRRPTTPTGVQPGFFALGRRRRRPRATGRPRRRRPTPVHASTLVAPRRDGAGRHPHRRPTAPQVLAPAGRPPRPRRRAGRPGRQRVLRRQHRRHRPDGRRRPRPRAGRRARRATATCCPTSACPTGRFLDGTTPGDLPRPVEVVATDGLALRGALAARSMSDAHRRGHRRPAERRQVARWSTASSASQVAIVEDEPGVTRDRKEVEAEWLGVPVPARRHRRLAARRRRPRRKVSRQVEQAVRGADVVLFVVDASVGVTEEDAGVADLAPAHRQARAARRQQGRRRPPRGATRGSSWRSASASPTRSARCTAGAPATCSTSSSRCFPTPTSDGRPSRPASAERRSRRPTSPPWRIVGRPNVGKSHPVQPADRRGPRGRARHAGHHPRRHRHGRRDRRRARSASSTPPACAARAKIDEGTEYYSLVRALQAVDDADVALLVIDATEGVTSQDQRLAERIDAAGCPVVVLLNKWELLDDAEAPGRGRPPSWPGRLHFIGEAPVLKISALTGKGVHKLLPVLADAIEHYHRRVPTRDVNEVIAEAQQAQPAPGGARVLYAPAGRDRPADVHPVRQPGGAAHLPALPRAQAARGVRPRGGADQAARSAPLD